MDACYRDLPVHPRRRHPKHLSAARKTMKPLSLGSSFRTLQRSVALAIVFAVVLGGIAHAAHFHKEDFGQHSEVHLDCSLCTFMAGGAALPDMPAFGPAVASFLYLSSFARPAPRGIEAASYEARGPPRA
jgi:hypothetical protein